MEVLIKSRKASEGQRKNFVQLNSYLPYYLSSVMLIMLATEEALR